MKTNLFCHVSLQKSIQMSKYCFLISRHSNLDWFFTHWHGQKDAFTASMIKKNNLLYVLKPPKTLLPVERSCWIKRLAISNHVKLQRTFVLSHLIRGNERTQYTLEGVKSDLTLNLWSTTVCSAVGRSKNLGGAISATRYFDGTCFAFQTAKIWGEGGIRVPPAPWFQRPCSGSAHPSA